MTSLDLDADAPEEVAQVHRESASDPARAWQTIWKAVASRLENAANAGAYDAARREIES